MLLKVYASYDRKAKIYGTPFHGRNDEEVTRAFADIARDKNHPIGKHPEDYDLVQLANWNDETGYYLENTPRIMTNASVFVMKNDDEKPVIKK